MKQKYQVNALLEKYFNDMNADMEFMRYRKVKSNKIIFKPGDTIEYLYFIVSGDVRLTFNDKQLMLPHETLIGDYQPLRKVSRRVTTLQAVSSARLVVIPIDYFEKIKPDIMRNDLFIKQTLYLQDQRADYMASRIFSYKQVYRGQQIIADHGENIIDSILIKSGLFTVRKYIGVSIISKYNIQVQKQFSLVQVGQGQIVKENLICNTPKGQIFICKDIYAKNLLQNFKQIQNLFENIYKKKQSRIQREKIIKNICHPQFHLITSILPSVFMNSRRKTEKMIPKLKNNKLKIKTQMNQYENQKLEKLSKNHFEIGRENNQLCSSPTDINFTLIPFVNIRKPTLPKTNRISHSRIIKSLLKNASSEKFQYNKSSSPKIIHNQQQIPQIFNNKFKRKMFLKPNNPFRHFKSKSVPIQQDMNTFLKESLIQRTQQDAMESTISKVTKQFLKFKS